MTSGRRTPDPARRRFLAGTCRLAAASACLPLVPLLGGCDGEKPSAGPLRVALADLPAGERVRVEHDGIAYELVRTADGVTARSLLCTHQGCNVAWVPARDVYVCPCHDGEFAADGSPIYGPPREPLRDVPVTIDGEEVVVG